MNPDFHHKVTPRHLTLNAYLYIRQSKDIKAQRNSRDYQLAECQKYYDARADSLPTQADEVFSDIDVSGSKVRFADQPEGG